jgi:periplasmic protein TonB
MSSTRTESSRRRRDNGRGTRRQQADRWVFGAGFGVSVAVHVAALAFAGLPIVPHEPPIGRAPLLAVETPLLTAVQLPEPERVKPPEREPVESTNAIPVPVPSVVQEPPVVRDVAAAPLVGPPPAPARPDSAARPAPRALAGSVAHGQYEQEVTRWVERQRDYPLAARRRGLEGTAIVRLRLRADGSLVQAQIVRDTGHAILDRAAIGMVERAAPYPGVPGEFGGSSVEVLVPIQFSLGG